MESQRTRSREYLAEMLSDNLGNEKAGALVAEAASKLGLGAEMSQDQALDVLERIAIEPGLVGITARFAKTRLHLRWNQ